MLAHSLHKLSWITTIVFVGESFFMEELSISALALRGTQHFQYLAQAYLENICYFMARCAGNYLVLSEVPANSLHYVSHSFRAHASVRNLTPTKCNLSGWIRTCVAPLTVANFQPWSRAGYSIIGERSGRASHPCNTRRGT
jgi:hypothetical protein